MKASSSCQNITINVVTFFGMVLIGLAELSFKNLFDMQDTQKYNHAGILCLV